MASKETYYSVKRDLETGDQRAGRNIVLTRLGLGCTLQARRKGSHLYSLYMYIYIYNIQALCRVNSKCTVALCSEYTRPLSFENFLICLDRFVLLDLGANEYWAFFNLFIFSVLCWGLVLRGTWGQMNTWRFIFYSILFFLYLCWGLVLRWTWQQLNIGRFIYSIFFF